MKIANIFGMIAGVFGIVLTLMNTNLTYAEGPATGLGVANKHDNIGNVFSLLSFLFFVLTAVSAYNLYEIKRRKQ